MNRCVVSYTAKRKLIREVYVFKGQRIDNYFDFLHRMTLNNWDAIVLEAKDELDAYIKAKKKLKEQTSA